MDGTPPNGESGSKVVVQHWKFKAPAQQVGVGRGAGPADLRMRMKKAISSPTLGGSGGSGGGMSQISHWKLDRSVGLTPVSTSVIGGMAGGSGIPGLPIGRGSGDGTMAGPGEGYAQLPVAGKVYGGMLPSRHHPYSGSRSRASSDTSDGSTDNSAATSPMNSPRMTMNPPRSRSLDFDSRQYEHVNPLALLSAARNHHSAGDNPGGIAAAHRSRSRGSTSPGGSPLIGSPLEGSPNPSPHRGTSPAQGDLAQALLTLHVNNQMGGDPQQALEMQQAGLPSPSQTAKPPRLIAKIARQRRRSFSRTNSPRDPAVPSMIPEDEEGQFDQFSDAMVTSTTSAVGTPNDRGSAAGGETAGENRMAIQMLLTEDAVMEDAQPLPFPRIRAPNVFPGGVGAGSMGAQGSGGFGGAAASPNGPGSFGGAGGAGPSSAPPNLSVTSADGPSAMAISRLLS